MFLGEAVQKKKKEEEIKAKKKLLRFTQITEYFKRGWCILDFSGWHNEVSSSL